MNTVILRDYILQSYNYATSKQLTVYIVIVMCHWSLNTKCSSIFFPEHTLVLNNIERIAFVLMFGFYRWKVGDSLIIYA